MNSDVAIVGAGITGFSTAFHLADRGAGSVVVYEREGIGAGASGVQPGGVRQQWSTRLNCLMARASLAFYSQLEEQLSPRSAPVFRPCGYVFVAHAQETLARLRRDLATQNAVGVPSRFVGAEELRELVPELETAEVVGSARRTATSTARSRLSRRLPKPCVAWASRSSTPTSCASRPRAPAGGWSWRTALTPRPRRWSSPPASTRRSFWARSGSTFRSRPKRDGSSASSAVAGAYLPRSSRTGWWFWSDSPRSPWSRFVS